MKHLERRLAQVLRENRLSPRSAPAKLLQQIRTDLAADSGGEAFLSMREKYLIDRSASLILLCSSIESWAFRQTSLFDENGKMCPALSTNYLSYINSLRLNLVALGLRPERPIKDLSLNDYIKQSSKQPPAEELPQAEETESQEAIP